MTLLDHFRSHGWVRLEGTFSAAEAAAMREAVWRILSRRGIWRDNPATWREERPGHLQELKDNPVFRAAWGKRVIAAVDEVMDGGAWLMPKSPGAHFIAFPDGAEWNIPSSGWHIDANYLSALAPPAGARLFALFGDVEPRAGGTLMVSGSHRLVHKWFKDHPPTPGTRGAEFRKLLQAHPYIRDLHTLGGCNERVVRFMENVDEVDGILLQVVENTGAAGDVILIHALMLHVAAPNSGSKPRFLLSSGVDTVAMWAEAAVPLPAKAGHGVLLHQPKLQFRRQTQKVK
jgi:ectoine hydroxylase-related dioxygenase (phytanoyl-CoA dioxygenase family)